MVFEGNADGNVGWRVVEVVVVEGPAFEWDVQLSRTGKAQMGWLSRDASHLNVSLDGRITHK